jgi:tRNA nucleotidyltransferase/poly(A) polymerase
MVDNSATPIIALTTREESLFKTLAAVVSKLNLATTVRVNGGWVRDKIMGLESDDIDVSLDDLSGEDFAKLVTEQLT